MSIANNFMGPEEFLAGEPEAAAGGQRLNGILQRHLGKILGSMYPETANAILADFYEPEASAGAQFGIAKPRLALVPKEAETLAKSSVSQLEARHHDVLELIADGLTNKEIADKIAREARWVKYAISIIYSALDVNTATRTQAVRRGYEEGLLGPRKKSRELFLSPPSVSDREQEYLIMLSEGMMDPTIGYRTGLSPATIKAFNGNLIRKLGARNRANAVGIAIDMGLIIEPQLKLPV